LPILFKIQRQRLILEEYTLNSGLCSSLASSFAVVPNCINQISLTQNGLKDAQLAVLIEGLQKLETMKSIVIKHNEVHLKTTEALQPLMKRVFPHNV